MNDEYVEISDGDDDEISDEDIKDYAEWMGMNLPEDNKYLWIAKEALTAKLPAPWKQYQKKDGSGEPFYFNTETGESSWEHPLDQHFKEMYQKEKEKEKKQKNNDQPKSKQQQPKTQTKPKEKDQKQTKKVEKEPLLLEDYEEEEEEENDPFIQDDSESDSVPRLRNKPQETKPKKASPEQNKNNKKNSSTTATNNNNKTTNTNKQIPKQTTTTTTTSSNNNAVREQQERELQQLKQQHQREIDDENRNHQMRISQLRSDNELQYEREKNQIRDNYNNQIQQEKNRYESELQRIRAENQKGLTEAQKSQLAQHQNTFEEEKKRQEKAHQTEMDNMRQAHKREIDFMNTAFQTEKQSTEQRQKQELASLNSQFAQEKSRIQKANKDEISKLQQSNAKEIEQIKQQHNQQVEQLKQKLAETTKQMQKKAKQKLDKAKLEQDVDVYKKELESRKNQLTEGFNKDVEIMRKKYQIRKKEIREQLKQELVDFKEEEARKIEQAKKKQSDSAVLNDLQTTYEAKKQRLEVQFQEEIDEMMNDHKKVLEDMKKKHLKLVQVLNNEDEEMKQDAELAKQNFLTKKKREMKKLSAQYDDQIAELSDKYELRKKQEKAAFQREMEETFANIKQEQERVTKRRRNYSLITYPPYAIRPQRVHSVLTFSTQKIYSQKGQQMPSQQQMSFNKTYAPDFTMASQSMMPMRQMANSLVLPGSEDIFAMKIQKQKGKVSKYENQFDSACESIEGGIKTAQHKMQQVQQQYRSYINDQNRTLSQLALDFQQQTTALTTSLHTTLTDIENTYRNAINNMQIRQNNNVSIPPQSERKYARPLIRKRRQLYDESSNTTELTESELIDSDTEKMLKLWRRSRDSQKN